MQTLVVQFEKADWKDISSNQETKQATDKIIDLLRAKCLVKDDDILTPAAVWFLRRRYIYCIKYKKNSNGNGDEEGKVANPMAIGSVLN